MRVGFATDPGATRELNEDNLYINEDIGLFVLADGMGGHNAGEIASKIAVTVVGVVIEEELETSPNIEGLLRSAVEKANGVIVHKSLHRTDWTEMGSTVVVALEHNGQVVVAHVGDSRAYMIRGGQIQPLTEDHTFVAEWLKEGVITKEEARTHSARHGLMESLGITDDVEIDVGVWSWDEGGGCLLLCSDGLTDMIDDEEILAIVESSAEPQDACDRLVDAANKAGGQDNITVIVVCR